MSIETLEILISRALEIAGEVTFSWQGGEPTLMGLSSYERVTELQKKYKKNGQKITNTFQTNGILLDESWAEFFKKNSFLVGLSMDGPYNIHDEYRVTKNGDPTHHLVLRKIKLLQRYNVEFNILAVVTDKNSKKPEALFKYFQDLGVKYMQFIPCLEKDKNGIAPFSVDPNSYGNFLCSMFDRWYNKGTPSCYIREYEEWLIAYAYRVNPCMFSPYCQGALVIEHNGDIYPCDFFVEPKWLLGNIKRDSLEDTLSSKLYKDFKERKQNLDNRCKNCKWLRLCWGGCPKFRIDKRGKEINYSYFCLSYQKFFEHSDRYFKNLVQGLKGSIY